MEIKAFINEFHPSTKIFADEKWLIFAAMQRTSKHSTDLTHEVDDLLIAACSSAPGSDVLPIRHPKRIFDLMSRKTTILDGMLARPGREYPFAQRGALRRIIQDPEANKLIDGPLDHYSSSAHTPIGVDEAIELYYARIVERDESTTMFGMANDRSVARLGNAILLPLELKM